MLVSLGGLALGYYAYRGFDSAAAQDPAKRVTGAWYWNLLQNRYKIDQFYDLVFVKTGHWLSDVLTYRWIDKKVIDGFIEGVAKGTMNVGAAVRRWIDVRVVNWLADHIGIGVRASSRELRQVQTGRIQQYMLLAVLLVVIVGAVFYVVLRILG